MRREPEVPEARALGSSQSVEVDREATRRARRSGQLVDRHDGSPNLGSRGASGAAPEGTEEDAPGSRPDGRLCDRVGAGEARPADEAGPVGLRRNRMARARARRLPWVESLARAAWLAELATRSRGVGLGFDCAGGSGPRSRWVIRREILSQVHQQELFEPGAQRAPQGPTALAGPRGRGRLERLARVDASRQRAFSAEED